MVDIRQVSDKEKREYIDRTKVVFEKIRTDIAQLEVDMESNDLITQAAAVWVSGNLCQWYDDFMGQIKKIDKERETLNQLQQEIKETANVNQST